MTTKIELEKMRFYAYHGVMPQETKVGNDFVVDLILTAPLEQAVKSDELDDTINYAAVYAVVKEQMDIPSKLIERPSEVMSIAHRSSLVKLSPEINLLPGLVLRQKIFII